MVADARWNPHRGRGIPKADLRHGHASDLVRLKRAAVAFAMIVAVAVAVVVVNPRGWRTRILSRVFRTYNPPAVISPPPGFTPQAPPGFTVSVFARGLKEPRWLAVAP